ncbi:glucose-6-phosphate isomerase [Psychrobacter sp.]|uniref:glucose-6-phosphate isomerase n=1 Tax=Psychrobacter sp. TaxID=56811 RepID=UPI003F9517D1
MSNPELTSQWKTLKSLAPSVGDLNALFKKDSSRTSNLLIDFEGVCFDYSKELINTEIKSQLIALAEEMNLKGAIDKMVSGHKVNITEDRQALHTALRLPEGSSLIVDGVDIAKKVHESLAAVNSIVDRLTTGVWRGCSGLAITDVVNIGVGGSDLGPLMACTALEEWTGETGITQRGLKYNSINTHFVSNMDGTQLEKLLNVLNPATTVFIISSKSFSTSDTLSNANTALSWLLKECSDLEVVKKNHFIGISAVSHKMDEWGICKKNQLELWDWVGGRFSMWSAIGLTVALKIGMSNFRELLAGAHLMDQHFINTPFSENIPVMMGLIGVWNSSFLGIHAHAVLPYDGRLSHFPNYLTQLEMESNGKSTNLQGHAVTFNTCPILWGEIGSNAQHAFYQLLHQGTQKVTSDFIAFINRYDEGRQTINEQLSLQHKMSLANCLAQSRVLAFGNKAVDSHSMGEDDAQNNLHKHYHGNQPSSTFLINKLTPKTLGMLIGMYEHKVYVMASIWDINPFDQWGVEIGKVVAKDLNQAILQGSLKYDDSTNELLKRICGLS